MSDISHIDPNLKVETNVKESQTRFYDVKKPPFKIYGVFYEKGKFRRMPESIAKTVSLGVYELHTHTAGGRVRFKTNSPYVAIRTKMPKMTRMPHFAYTGSAGFDLYVSENEERFAGAFVPPDSASQGYESIIYLEATKMREVTINFPLYSEIEELYIGLKKGSLIEEPSPYNEEKPIVYYGSSITQGGCASRPGNSYQNIIARRFNWNYINLGFSGNAKAEPEVADYIKNLKMSAFVYDYDHNAPSIEHLKSTHENMFLSIRKRNPLLPIIIMSRPKFYLSNTENQRFSVIKSTYDNAVSRGDKNTYLIDGKTLMRLALDNGTVDDCHPNDLGFMSMADAITEVLRVISI